METKTTRQRSWSLSALNLYSQCALKYKYVKIDKLEEPPSWALMNGIQQHALAEQFLRGKITGMPPALKKFEREFKKLKSLNALPEEAIVTDNKWQIITDDNAWVHPEAWLRMKIDARVDNFIVDFKTGKHYDEHYDQAELYATTILFNSPETDVVDVEFWYLGTGEVYPYAFEQKDAQSYVQKWNNKVESMFNDATYEPTINKWCKYCHFKSRCPAFK